MLEAMESDGKHDDELHTATCRLIVA